MPLPAGHIFLDIEKEYQGEYWTNRYVLAAASPAAGLGAAQQIVGIERAVTNSPILFTRFRLSDDVANTDNYQIVQVNLYGLDPIGSNVLLPLFNVVRVDFTPVGGGRPSRKYLRGLLTELTAEFNTIQPGPVGTWQAAYADAMLTVEEYVDVDGQAFQYSSIYPKVAMRQLRRGSKRKAPVTNPAPT